MRKYKPVIKENLGIEGNQLSMMNSTNMYDTDGMTENDILCKNFRKETGTCKTGCIKSKVQKGHECPYEPGKDQAQKCNCFRA